MKSTLIRRVAPFLIAAILGVAGFFLGTKLNLFTSDLHLIQKGLWFPIGATPEERIVAVAADAGFGYLEGETGRVYSTCTFINEVDECWIEANGLLPVYEGSCVNAEVRRPPPDTVKRSIQCGWGEVGDITGIAVREDGKGNPTTPRPSQSEVPEWGTPGPETTVYRSSRPNHFTETIFRPSKGD